MLDKWKILTQDKQVKLLVVFLTAVFALPSYFWLSGTQPSQPSAIETQEEVSISTTGNNSSVASGTKGDITFNINGLNTEKQP